MSILFLFLMLLEKPAQGLWITNFETAKAAAATNKKLILLSFSGSDWCIPCIKMEESFFEQPIFKEYAESHLILLKADFPRLKKNQLDAKQIKQNEKIAEKYNTEGVFPLTLILNAEGKVIQKYEGLPKGTVDNFIESLNHITTP